MLTEFMLQTFVQHSGCCPCNQSVFEHVSHARGRQYYELQSPNDSINESFRERLDATAIDVFGALVSHLGGEKKHFARVCMVRMSCC